VRGDAEHPGRGGQALQGLMQSGRAPIFGQRIFGRRGGR
jgi:hypothetical protein